MATGVYGPCVAGHTAMIHDRGGRNREATLVEMSKIRWGRTLDDQDMATITISGKRSCEAQAAELLKIKTRRHEIVIFRGNERVFEGPILEVNWYSNRVQIIAKDVTEYLRGTAISRKWDYTTEANPSRALMTKRVSDILNWELQTPYNMVIGTGSAARTVTVNRWEQQSPSANILPYLEVRPSSTLYTLSITEAFEMTVLEHLKDLARGGLNFTTIGRKIVVWDSAQEIGRTRKLTDADFVGELRVIESGSDYRGPTHISSSRDEKEDQIGVGHAGEVNSYYGPWETVVSSQTEGTDTPTRDALNSQAQRERLGKTKPPVQIILPSPARFIPSADIGVMDLVPGVIMPVQAQFNLRPVSQDQMLQSMSVSEDASGETVTVSLIPAGAVEV